MRNLLKAVLILALMLAIRKLFARPKCKECPYVDPWIVTMFPQYEWN